MVFTEEKLIKNTIQSDSRWYKKRKKVEKVFVKNKKNDEYFC